MYFYKKSIKYVIRQKRLKPLDVEFMKAVHNKVNIVPVIAKSDTLTRQEVNKLKKKILREIEENKINIYNLPTADDDEDEEFKEQTRQLKVIRNTDLQTQIEFLLFIKYFLTFSVLGY